MHKWKQNAQQGIMAAGIQTDANMGRNLNHWPCWHDNKTWLKYYATATFSFDDNKRTDRHLEAVICCPLVLLNFFWLLLTLLIQHMANKLSVASERLPWIRTIFSHIFQKSLLKNYFLFFLYSFSKVSKCLYDESLKKRRSGRRECGCGLFIISNALICTVLLFNVYFLIFCKSHTPRQRCFVCWS